ncbi:MAG: hypothetical protein A3B47_04395 [Candidatus Levybacteria bacterium RIFCSPLOWO2_01_FULL_39_24]|nr:MAG: hypothetical protein A2800_04455 [Candidatus Levybacteria bacterium RIFCSPHIGHO2_01_FULL_40_16]OGH28873.1 MAG: hypothetical protein A3E12_00195 [Candidatus Levybacteria bacterium RIFCSPHIGHO2_12_FULL_39_9]OGH46330.1 MAG: hypothetical protein A3B47_04395 [Candidatus Levybacteria bacterium RIFCSPLOWO2_01_FULL_39_24]
MKFKNIKKKSPPAGGKNKQSPSNSRAIPASVKASAGKPVNFKFSLPKINHVTLIKLYGGALRVFVVFIFIVAVIIVGLDFQENLQIKQDIDSQRIILNRELNFWKDFISKRQNYPIAYFQASILEYKLGNTSKAKTHLEKGLILDPSSTDGQRLEKFLVNK